MRIAPWFSDNAGSNLLGELSCLCRDAGHVTGGAVRIRTLCQNKTASILSYVARCSQRA